ncbi:MAG: hypothetical protein ACI3XO_03595 [Eubacteriales bacterium]
MKYELILHPPIGARCGSIDVQIKNGIAREMLHLLLHSETFAGSIDSDVHCRLAGKLVTLMNTTPYQVVGRIAEDFVEMYLNRNRGSFHLNVTPCR